MRARQGAFAEQQWIFAKAAVAFALSGYSQQLSEKPRKAKEILLSLRLSDPRGLGKERRVSDNHCFSEECCFCDDLSLYSFSKSHCVFKRLRKVF